MATIDEKIRTRAAQSCKVCGAQGTPLYNHLRDRLFSVPGEWNLKKCQNISCGLVWLDPMPREEDIGKAYRTYYTHQDKKPKNTLLRRVYRRIAVGYSANRYGYEIKGVSVLDRLLGRLIYLHPGRRSDLDYRVFYLNAQLGGRLLEIGTGSGESLKRMSDLGWLVEGVDVDPSGVKNAKAKGLNVHLGSLEQQDYADNTFDVITMNHVIEHVHEPLALLKECRRILKPGGEIVVVTPNILSWVHRLYKSNWLHLDPPRHLHLFTIEALKNMAMQAKFTGIECSSSLRARGVFLTSKSILNTGKVDLAGKYSLTTHLWAEIMELVEWLLMKLGIVEGEEIVLICKK